MASFADISIRFSANLKEFSSQMQNAERDLKKVGTKFKEVGAGLTIGVTAPILGLGAAAINVAADFEVLETSLVTAFDGSESAAKGALESITKFAASTPFQIEEVADAFIKLKNLGLDPSEAALTSYGNTASAMGKSLNQVIEAVADAATGEFERLKEFGIKSKSEGDKVTFTFKGIATTVKKDSASIQKFLLNIGDTDFAGGMERQSKTFKGQLSTLKDSLAQTGVEFGKIILQYIKPFVARIGELANSFKNLSPETKKIIVIVSALAAALGPLLVTIGLLTTNVIPGLIVAFAAIKTAFTALTVTIAANPFGAIAVVLGVAAAAFIAFGNSTEKAVKQQTILEQVSDAAAKSIAGEKAKLEELLFIARDEQVSKEQRVKAIQELNALSPKYLGNLTLERINTDEARKAIDLYNESLLRTAKVKAAQARLTDIQSKIIDAEINSSKSRKSRAEEILELDKKIAKGYEGAIRQKEQLLGIENAGNVVGKARIQNLNEEANALLEIIKNNDDFTTSLNATASAASGEFKRAELSPIKLDPAGLSGIYAQNEALQKQIDIWKEVQAQYPEGSRQYQDYASKIEQGNITISNSLRGLVTDNSQLVDSIDQSANNFIANMERMKQVAVAVGETVGSAFESFTGRLVNSLGLADDGFQGFVKGLSDTVLKLIAQMLAAAISQSIAGATASGTATGPAAVFSTPAFIATAVGGVLAAFASIPKFADGGIAYGPTLGLMGEYAGARNNPEVIAPLNKLKDLINPSGSGVELSLGSIIRGSDLQIVINRAIDKKLRMS